MSKKEILDRIFNSDPYGLLDIPLTEEEQLYLDNHPEIFVTN